MANISSTIDERGIKNGMRHNMNTIVTKPNSRLRALNRGEYESSRVDLKKNFKTTVQSPDPDFTQNDSKLIHYNSQLQILTN